MCLAKRNTSGRAMSVCGTLILFSLVVGCVQEMANEGRIKPLQASTAFGNGMSAREPVPGTVARGQLQLDTPFFTGKESGQYVTELPAEALAGRSLEQLLTRGRERYGIYCSQCHGLVGGGTGGAPIYEKLVGMVVLRGFPSPPTYHQERLRTMPLGHFFDVITNGYGRMPAHNYLVAPEDRWAIAAYIRALQLSQSAPRDELPPSTINVLNHSLAGEPSTPLTTD
jgi:mono/diheme cytochrome c family protein